MSKKNCARLATSAARKPSNTSSGIPSGFASDATITARLALESSTLTPLLKRLEVAGLLRRTRNPTNERQVQISLTNKGRDVRGNAGCLGQALVVASGETAAELGRLNRDITDLRNAIYCRISGWDPLVQETS